MFPLLSGICSQCKSTGAHLQIKCSSGSVWVWQQPRKLWSLSASSLDVVLYVGLKSVKYQQTMRQSGWDSADGLFSCTIVHTGSWGKLITECPGFLCDSNLVVFARSSCSTWDSHFFSSPSLLSGGIHSDLAAQGDTGTILFTRDNMTWWKVYWKSWMFVIPLCLTWTLNSFNFKSKTPH